MAQPPSGYSLQRGAYFTNDGEGPFAWDGSVMQPLGTGGFASDAETIAGVLPSKAVTPASLDAWNEALQAGPDFLSMYTGLDLSNPDPYVNPLAAAFGTSNPGGGNGMGYHRAANVQQDGTTTTAAIGSTTLQNRRPRATHNSTAAANTAAGITTSVVFFLRDSSSRWGGTAMGMYGCADAVDNSATAGQFSGLIAAAPAVTVNTGALVNCIGIGVTGGGSTNLQVWCNDGSGAATAYNLTTQPGNAGSTVNWPGHVNDGSELYWWAIDNLTSGTFDITVWRLSTGDKAYCSITPAITTDVPAGGTGMRFCHRRCTMAGTNAVIVHMDALAFVSAGKLRDMLRGPKGTAGLTFASGGDLVTGATVNSYGMPVTYRNAGVPMTVTYDADGVTPLYETVTGTALVRVFSQVAGSNGGLYSVTSGIVRIGDRWVVDSTQRTTLGTATGGLSTGTAIFNTTAGAAQVWNGSTWV